MYRQAGRQAKHPHPHLQPRREHEGGNGGLPRRQEHALETHQGPQRGDNAGIGQRQVQLVVHATRHVRRGEGRGEGKGGGGGGSARELPGVCEHHLHACVCAHAAGRGAAVNTGGLRLARLLSSGAAVGHGRRPAPPRPPAGTRCWSPSRTLPRSRRAPPCWRSPGNPAHTRPHPHPHATVHKRHTPPHHAYPGASGRRVPRGAPPTSHHVHNGTCEWGSSGGTACTPVGERVPPRRRVRGGRTLIPPPPHTHRIWAPTHGAPPPQKKTPSPSTRKRIHAREHPRTAKPA
jgi:hypothetical protein